MAAVPGKGEVFDFSKTLAGDDAVGMLAKLAWEAAAIYEAKDDSPIVRMWRSANAASTAWHLHEWIWKCCDTPRKITLLEALGAPGSGWKGYVRALQRKSGALAICRQIATAGKHVGVEFNREDISAEVEVSGSGITQVYFLWEGERVLDFDVYASAWRFWNQVYCDLGLRHAQELREAMPWAFENMSE